MAVPEAHVAARVSRSPAAQPPPPDQRAGRFPEMPIPPVSSTSSISSSEVEGDVHDVPDARAPAATTRNAGDAKVDAAGENGTVSSKAAKILGMDSSDVSRFVVEHEEREARRSAGDLPGRPSAADRARHAREQREYEASGAKARWDAARAASGCATRCRTTTSRRCGRNVRSFRGTAE